MLDVDSGLQPPIGVAESKPAAALKKTGSLALWNANVGGGRLLKKNRKNADYPDHTAAMGKIYFFGLLP
ncbi:hypothetical protein TWF225_006215 [Orbilia oligospora]|nr:hypothetical protein TWF225_006215 [Orbilia oligospora]